MDLAPAARELLNLIEAMNEAEGKPASRWTLDHIMEYGSEDYDVTRLQELLGPRPRRSALFLHLGDLYDHYLIKMGPSGYEVIHAD